MENIVIIEEKDSVLNVDSEEQPKCVKQVGERDIELLTRLKASTLRLSFLFIFKHNS